MSGDVSLKMITVKGPKTEASLKLWKEKTMFSKYATAHNCA